MKPIHAFTCSVDQDGGSAIEDISGSHLFRCLAGKSSRCRGARSRHSSFGRLKKMVPTETLTSMLEDPSSGSKDHIWDSSQPWVRTAGYPGVLPRAIPQHSRCSGRPDQLVVGVDVQFLDDVATEVLGTVSPRGMLTRLGFVDLAIDDLGHADISQQAVVRRWRRVFLQNA